MNKKNIVLTVSSSEYPRAMSLSCVNTLSIGHMYYGISRSGRLMRDSAPPSARLGVMILSDTYGLGQASRIGFDAARLSSEVIAEAVYRGYSGVVADFEGEVSESLSAFLLVLEEALAAQKINLFVNPKYAQYTKTSKILISSQITGGAFAVYLEEMCNKYTSIRLALEIVPICMDFYLPSNSASGKKMTKNELKELLERVAPMPFYSRELCARYFTYMSGDHSAHFVLYDDARTIASKLMTAANIGISHAFMLYNEVHEIADDIMAVMEEAMAHSY